MMESERCLYESLVNEITKGMEQVKQLRASSSGNQESMLERMLASHEEALSILNGSASEEHCESVVSSTPDASASTRMDAQSEEVSSSDKRKRKLFSRITVQVSTVTLSESAINDGYSWRKYGQKDVLGAKYPRSYFRCAHRHTRGCSATKQVQRSDDDPSMFSVTYRGKHTCSEPVAPQHAAPVSRTNTDGSNSKIEPVAPQDVAPVSGTTLDEATPR